jgi:hypothetical protein
MTRRIDPVSRMLSNLAEVKSSCDFLGPAQEVTRRPDPSYFPKTTDSQPVAKAIQPDSNGKLTSYFKVLGD